MKINEEVNPVSFMQGLGRSQSDYSYSPSMLGQVSREDAIVFMSGLGQAPFLSLAQQAKQLMAKSLVKPSVAIAPAVQAQMIAAKIVEPAKPLDTIPLMLKELQARVAALEVATRRAVPPEANESRAVMGAMQEAAKAAAVAKQERAKTTILLRQLDKPGAAAAAVKYLQALRKAIILATKAEKTRIARGLDTYANMFLTQAEFLAGGLKGQEAKVGMMPGTEGTRVLVGRLEAMAKQMKDASAAIAAMSDDPSVVELSDQRIAEVANKFNIRTTMHQRNEDQRALVSVLSDAMDSALAQARDYDGAVKYYGNDTVGRLMADIEFGNNAGVVGMLNRFEQMLGAKGVNTPLALGAKLLTAAPTLAREAKAASDAMAARIGQAAPMAKLAGLAATGCAACTGRVSGLRGVGALGGEWEDWSDNARRVWADVTGDKNKAFELWKLSRKRPCVAFFDPESSEGPGTADAPNPKYRPCIEGSVLDRLVGTLAPPWEDPGKSARGLPMNWSTDPTTVKNKGSGWDATFTYQKPPKPEQPTTGTGSQQQQTQPTSPRMEDIIGGRINIPGGGREFFLGKKTTTETTPKVEEKKDNTMIYVAIGGVAVVGLAAFMLMGRRQTA